MSVNEIVKTFFIFVLAAVIVFFVRFQRLASPEAIRFTESREVLIHETTDTDGLIRILVEMDAEFDAEEVSWAAKTLGWSRYLPGRYEFNEGVAYQQFFPKIALGMQDPVRVTILPGSDPLRFSLLMSQYFRADSLDFIGVFQDSSSLALEQNLGGQELFARMMPDTYDFYWTASPESVIHRILNEFNSRVTDGMASEIRESAMSLNEILTLASITEWEARHNDEKPRISGLYLNRLETGMLLQADPTILFALGERRRLLFEDYQIDHPYNTYHHPGLPPGPITNPDVASIRSVLNPENHEYLYMVASPDGYHRFSRTFDEHRQASAEWRRWIQEQYRIRDENDRLEAESGTK